MKIDWMRRYNDAKQPRVTFSIIADLAPFYEALERMTKGLRTMRLPELSHPPTRKIP